MTSAELRRWHEAGCFCRFQVTLTNKFLPLGLARYVGNNICLLACRAASLLTPPTTLHTHGSSLQFRFVYFIHRWNISFLQLCTVLNIIGILFKTCPFHKICLCAVIICSIKYILYHQKFYDIFKNEFLLS